ncbi:TauD/TfdA family dioxygenase [Roseomonas hellenica]|uniref:TauD/TfdA family dioxygenase n=1 Tax=Plastoroseomonas hellenica TaxID=2687306 RepID=A0ABS5EUD7_9PROT|nr:TauD/TfdA family dioxygenase [Plastoroseomonas hellenica]MBR0663897.1 TauD/TfdA family dioxygenase [Plastoroseomonas hellenica]
MSAHSATILTRPSAEGGARVRALAPALGAEITGLDLAAGVTPEAVALVLESLHRYGVVVVRDQHLTPEEQLGFMGRLGPVKTSSYSRANAFCVPGYPDMMVISNIVENGRNIGLMDAGAMWHADGTHMARPDMYTALYALEVPQRDGKPLGDTLFASTAEAYDALPDALRERVTGRRAVHSFAHHIEKKRRLGDLRRPPLTEAQKAELPDVEHPVVARHPVTGRRTLFVTEGHTARIAGLAPEESDALLEELWAHIRRPEFIYRHSWRVGDLLIWDNRATQHLAIFDYGELRRRMHRVETIGPVPE